MNADQNNSSGIRLWIIFGLFIGLIVGLIVYEVRQYIMAKEQRENFEAVRKIQSEQIKKAYEENLKIEAEESEDSMPLSDSL